LKHIVLKSSWLVMLMAVLLMGSAQARASTSDTDQPSVTKKARKKTGVSGQIRFLPGSAETTKERSSRLKRECKGLVNAGACSGYTS
jgi:UDP-N-acetyl-D-mannosaminuronic acid transferase (WecB/TagA/CpsF family)